MSADPGRALKQSHVTRGAVRVITEMTVLSLITSTEAY